jgi:hypothetical protein
MGQGAQEQASIQQQLELMETGKEIGKGPKPTEVTRRLAKNDSISLMIS